MKQKSKRGKWSIRHIRPKRLRQFLKQIADGDTHTLLYIMFAHWEFIRMLAEVGTPLHATEYVRDEQMCCVLSEYVRTAYTFGKDETDARQFLLHVCTNVMQNESFRSRYWVHTLTEPRTYVTQRLGHMHSPPGPTQDGSDAMSVETSCGDIAPPDTSHRCTQARLANRIRDILKYARIREESLDAPLGEDTDLSLLSTIPCKEIPSPEQATYHHHTRALVKRIFAQEGVPSKMLLTEMQRQAIELHYLEDNSVPNIASMLNISKTNVRSMIDMGLRKLRGTAREYDVHDIEIES